MAQVDSMAVNGMELRSMELKYGMEAAMEVKGMFEGMPGVRRPWCITNSQSEDYGKVCLPVSDARMQEFKACIDVKEFEHMFGVHEKARESTVFISKKPMSIQAINTLVKKESFVICLKRPSKYPSTNRLAFHNLLQKFLPATTLSTLKA